MRAGKLDQTITIRTRTTTKSSTGADVQGEPETFARVRASIGISKFGQKPEYVDTQGLVTKTVWDVHIRYISGVRESMDMLWEDRNVVLNIRQVQDAGPRPRHLLIIAEEQR